MHKKYIIGADECGWGSWAGNLVICAVKSSYDWKLPGLNDSKKLSPSKRDKINDNLLKLEGSDIVIAISECTSKEIDQYSPADALKLCYARAISQLYCEDSEVIIDGTIKISEIKRVGLKYNVNFNMNTSHMKSLVKADGKYPTVMAASIIGKSYRDNEMKTRYSALYPEYEFDKNFGYGVQNHRALIDKFGLTPIHRLSYEPMKSIVKLTKNA